jgi:hypothetical protein
MPEWMHNRAEHILAKNPSMPKSEAFAIATQQMHSLGKGPKDYGTAEGKATAKAKFNTPKDDVKTSNPGNLKSSKMKKTSAMAFACLDELQKIGMGANALSPAVSAISRLKPAAAAAGVGGMPLLRQAENFRKPETAGTYKNLVRKARGAVQAPGTVATDTTPATPPMGKAASEEKDSGWLDSIGQALGKVNRGGNFAGGVSGKGPSQGFLDFQKQQAAKAVGKPTGSITPPR